MAKLDRSLIHGLPIFCAMGDDELDAVMADAKAQHIPKGTAVFQQAEIAKSFFVQLHGRLKVVKVTPHGQQVLIRFINPGDIYAFTKAFGREDYPATASAVVDSVTLLWPADEWDVFTAAPSLAPKVVQMMGARLQEAYTRVKDCRPRRSPSGSRTLSCGLSIKSAGRRKRGC